MKPPPLKQSRESSLSQATHAPPVNLLEPQQRHDIDLVRVICAFAIVWYHSLIPGGQFAHAGLMVFIFISIYLETTQKRKPIGSMAKRKSRRLLLPWAIWFSIYGIVNVAVGKPPIHMEHGFLAGVLAGTAIHLWYLPFIFCSLLLYSVSQALLRRRTIAIAGWVLYCMAMASVTYWRPLSISMGYPVEQYAHALPALFLACYLSNSDDTFQPFGLLSLALALAITATTLNLKGIGIPYLITIATCLAITSNSIKAKSNSVIRYLSQASFGFYLIHMLILFTARKLLKMADIDAGFLLPIGVSLISIILIAALREKTPTLASYST